MLGKRLGKYTFGLADDPKAKGKDKGNIGAAKVCIIAHLKHHPHFEPLLGGLCHSVW